MAKEEVQPITTQFANRDRTIEVGGNAGPDQGQARNTENDQKVSVRALRRFHQEENMKGDMVEPGKEFDVPRGRAAQLRANGLVEYVNDGDDAKIHGDETAKKIDERVKREKEQAKIPDKYKTTPLRNPELKLADVPKDAEGKK